MSPCGAFPSSSSSSNFCVLWNSCLPFCPFLFLSFSVLLISLARKTEIETPSLHLKVKITDICALLILRLHFTTLLTTTAGSWAGSYFVLFIFSRQVSAVSWLSWQGQMSRVLLLQVNCPRMTFIHCCPRSGQLILATSVFFRFHISPLLWFIVVWPTVCPLRRELQLIRHFREQSQWPWRHRLTDADNVTDCQCLTDIIIINNNSQQLCAVIFSSISDISYFFICYLLSSFRAGYFKVLACT